MSIDGKRDEWLFQYSIQKLAEGARKQRDFRRERVEWWTTQRDRIIAEVREKGLMVNQSVADDPMDASGGQLSYVSTRSRGPSISVDPKYQKSLDECHGKIDSHRQYVEIYDGWAQLLEDQRPETVMPLSQSDWLFFFGKVDPGI